MPTLDEHLDHLAPQPVVRAFTEAVAARAHVTPDRQGDYVSLRPGRGGPIAVYVHRSFVSIATPPALASEKATDIPGAILDEKTPATTYVLVPGAGLQSAPAACLTLCVEALEWRSTMPDTQDPDATSSALAQPKCTSCGLHHVGEC